MKRVLCVVLASLLILSQSQVVFANAEGVDLEAVRRQYSWGPQFFGGQNDAAFLVWQGGELIYERHADGHGMDVPHIVYSVTKSVVAALTGIAIEQGYIESVEQNVIDFFPEVEIAEGQESKTDMTIWHLLTMTSGMPGMADRGSSAGMFDPNDSGLASFLIPQLDAPGETFRYCSGATTQTLVGLLQRATGRGLLDFATEHLFGPLGMSSVVWETAADDSPAGGFGIQLSPADMLRFGQLYLNDGVWDGVRVLPENWLYLGHPTVPTFDFAGGLYYGFMFWGGENELGEFIQALGLGGSVISIYHELDMIVVRTGILDPWLQTSPLDLIGFMEMPFNVPDVRTSRRGMDRDDLTARVEEIRDNIHDFDLEGFIVKRFPHIDLPELRDNLRERLQSFDREELRGALHDFDRERLADIHAQVMELDLEGLLSRFAERFPDVTRAEIDSMLRSFDKDALLERLPSREELAELHQTLDKEQLRELREELVNALMNSEIRHPRRR